MPNSFVSSLAVTDVTYCYICNMSSEKLIVDDRRRNSSFYWSQYSLIVSYVYLDPDESDAAVSGQLKLVPESLNFISEGGHEGRTFPG